MRARETKAIPNITPGSPPNKTRNPPCIKQSCKNQLNDFIISFPLVLLLVPLSKTLLQPPSKEPAPLVVIPSSRFAHQDQLSWAGQGHSQEFP